MILSFTLLPIISAQLGGTDRAAGLPPTMMMLGRAVAAYPVGWLMDHIGRRLGLALGYLFTAAGSVLCVLSISMWESLPWLCAGVLLMGMGRGVSEQARFIAAEVYHPVKRAGVIGLIVFAGTIGAVGGPLLVSPSTWIATVFGLHAHAGPYMVSVVLAALALMLTLLLLYPDPMKIGRTLSGDLGGVDEKNTGRKLWRIFIDRTVRLGCGGDDNWSVRYDANYGDYTAAHESSRPWRTGDFVGDNGAYVGDVRTFEFDEPSGRPFRSSPNNSRRCIDTGCIRRANANFQSGFHACF